MLRYDFIPLVLRLPRYQPKCKKADPRQVCITAGGNLSVYPNELTTRIKDLTTSKQLLTSVVSTEGETLQGRILRSLTSGHHSTGTNKHKWT